MWACSRCIDDLAMESDHDGKLQSAQHLKTACTLNSSFQRMSTGAGPELGTSDSGPRSAGNIFRKTDSMPGEVG